MTFNQVLAAEVLELIRQFPEQHDQYNWSTDYDRNPVKSCGTKACIAGWVAAAQGKTLRQVEDELDAFESIPDYARDQLGITNEQADTMFHTYDNDGALAMLNLLIETNGKCSSDEMYAEGDK